MDAAPVNDKQKKQAPQTGLAFFILKNIFDLALYGLVAWAVITIVGQVFKLFEQLNWLFVVAVAIIAGAYVIRKFLIFLILRKKH